MQSGFNSESTLYNFHILFSKKIITLKTIMMTTLNLNFKGHYAVWF